MINLFRAKMMVGCTTLKKTKTKMKTMIILMIKRKIAWVKMHLMMMAIIWKRKMTSITKATRSFYKHKLKIIINWKKMLLPPRRGNQLLRNQLHQKRKLLKNNSLRNKRLKIRNEIYWYTYCLTVYIYVLKLYISCVHP